MTTQRVWLLYVTAAALLVALASPASGQYYKKRKKTNDSTEQRENLQEFRDEAEQVLAPVTGGTPGAAADAAWSIVLIAYAGDEQEATAAAELELVRRATAFSGARLERRDKATVVAYGRYTSADDPQAKIDLERVRMFESNGRRPYSRAILSPPSPEHLNGSLPDLDLRNAKKLFGKDRALYTLQVGIYGRADRTTARMTQAEITENRKLAEQGAVMLRRDGELAFYYHGPERSTVTVGVFGQRDHDPLGNPSAPNSMALIQAKERNPLNLLNGQGIREYYTQKDGTKATRMQPSVLVAVPNS